MLSPAEWAACYAACVQAMRTLYTVCGLVHADLSEYNILYWQGQPHFIDVGQVLVLFDLCVRTALISLAFFLSLAGLLPSFPLFHDCHSHLRRWTRRTRGPWTFSSATVTR